ncbi:MAG: S41 family peptidase [Candidatus Eremiobacteraeota bacterium]|nr:S41 family peptidase [Candidatus Eremiobacteraeota bacterium]
MNRSTALALGLALFALSAPAVAADDPARAVAAGAAAKLEAFYVYPSRAHTAAELVRRNAAAGTYDRLRDAALATKVTEDVAGVLHDKHVRLRYSEEVNPPDEAGGGKPSPAELAAMARQWREGGYGLGRVAHLPGNVGYIDLRNFPSVSDELNAVFDGAANSVAYSSAVVLDLRRNHGGDPAGIARFLSHFLPPKTHLNDFVGRGDGEPPISDSTFTGDVPGARITAPLYVLTSGETFSGGEECAYDVQALKRGTLIGAVTGGGANPGDTRRIDDHFSVFVPDARARNPITKTNWEGVGVEPDIAIARDRALITAYGMALDAKLRDASVTGGYHDRLATLRTKLDTMTDAEILAL